MRASVTICGACNEQARSIITLTSKVNDGGASDKSTSSLVPEGLGDALKWVIEMKTAEEELNRRLTFLGGFATAFRERIHTDIQVKPGSGPSVHAHKAILAASSDIFKNMLDSDECKAPPNDSITLAELDQEELDSLLEFLYRGTLPTEKVEKHAFCLLTASHKYGILFLYKFCERHLIKSLNSTNALEVLGLADVCCSQPLQKTALNWILKNAEDITSSPRFDAFALKSPHLSVKITRGLVRNMKKLRGAA